MLNFVTDIGWHL